MIALASRAISTGSRTPAATRAMIVVAAREGPAGRKPSMAATLIRMQNGPNNAQISRRRMRSMRRSGCPWEPSVGVVIAVPHGASRHLLLYVQKDQVDLGRRYRATGGIVATDARRSASYLHGGSAEHGPEETIRLESPSPDPTPNRESGGPGCGGRHGRPHVAGHLQLRCGKQLQRRHDPGARGRQSIYGLRLALDDDHLLRSIQGQRRLSAVEGRGCRRRSWALRDDRGRDRVPVRRHLLGRDGAAGRFMGLQLRGNERQWQTLRHADGGLAGADRDRVADSPANAEADAEADPQADAQAGAEANSQADPQTQPASHPPADGECNPNGDLRLLGPADAGIARNAGSQRRRGSDADGH